MPAPKSERNIDERLVSTLVSEQFPELPLESARFLAQGWDCTVWVIDERWAFRFPRRAVVAPCIARELAVLPLLAPKLPAAIPNPQFHGRPTGDYPWPFFGAALIPGEEASEAALDDDARLRIATALGEFLATLHDPGLIEAVDPLDALPEDANRRADMSSRVPRTREALADVERLGLWRAPAWIDALLDRASLLPPSRPNAIVHGDLHFRQLLVAQGALTGVIDWVDVCRADRAIDLQLVWSFLTPPARERFFTAYGPVGEAELARARVLALFLCATLAAYGRRERLVHVEREAVEGLVRTVTE